MRKRSKSGPEEEPELTIKKIKDEEKLMIYRSPISLKDMAAGQVAMLLWYHQNIRLSGVTDHFHGIICHNSHNEPYTHLSKKGYNYEYYDCDDELINKIAASVEKLPVPPRAQNIIKNYLKPVDRQLKHWLYYHNKRIFFHCKDVSKANEVADEIIWRSNGTIDYLATARNMLKSSKLNTIEKLRFMFTYCLENEMENIPPVVRNHIDNVSFELHPLIYYWNCYLRHTLNRIAIGDSPSIASYMLTKEHVDNWAAIEYFFDRLNFEEQIAQCVFLIREYGIRYQPWLLSKLTDSQQHRVFMDCAKSIIINFGEISSYKKYALEVWIRCKRIITEIEFAEIIEDLLNFSCQAYAGDTEHLPSLLTDIWKDASDDYKNFALNYKEHKIIDVIMFYEHFLNIDRLELLVELLSKANRTILQSVGNSKQFFYFCQSLLRKYPAYYLKKLIYTCVFDTEQRADFKRKILNDDETMKYFIALIREERNIERLNCLLLILVPYTEINEFKKRLLSSLSIINFCIFEICTDRCKQLNEFIDKFFSERIAASDFKKLLILQPQTIGMFCCKLDDGEFTKIKVSVEILFTHEDDLESVKKELLAECTNAMMKRSVPYLWGAEWDKFSTWCSDGENVTTN